MVSTTTTDGSTKPSPVYPSHLRVGQQSRHSSSNGSDVLSAHQSPGRAGIAKPGHPQNPHIQQRRMPAIDSDDGGGGGSGGSGGGAEDAGEVSLEYYKSQIQQLEAELIDFQASSKELEQELEKELEASEKQHRDLRNKNEKLRYEAEEWKAKYNKSKQEANSAQNALQKEITTLRDQNRTLQLQLRDIEVSNDDFEKKERIVMSSLEELEHKYNQSIERGVMLEEEVKIGEQEREELRIEAQRLRDELSDLRVEQELTVEKLENAMAIAAKYGKGAFHHVPPPSISSKPFSDTSSVISDPSTPTTTTTASASTMTPQSDHSGPPSPPISEVSTTPSHSSRLTTPLSDPATTPRPHHYHKHDGQRRKHSRGPSMGGNTGLPIPSSRSLYQIRGLIGQMQKLEQRVQNVRSKLPGPAATPPRASPRGGTPAQLTGIPSTITMRSHKKSRPPSTASDYSASAARISFSALDRPPRPASRSAYDRSSYDRSLFERPGSCTTASSRPSSRASAASGLSGSTNRSSLGGGTGTGTPSGIPQRPQSRQSASGRVTPLETHSESLAPLSSLPAPASTAGLRDPRDRERRSLGDGLVRRATFSMTSSAGGGGSAIPVPGAGGGGIAGGGSAIPRKSFGLAVQAGKERRMSSVGPTTKAPPPPTEAEIEEARRRLADLGETY